jgi:steroid delta-isomerase-like uncharacterized protein
MRKELRAIALRWMVEIWQQGNVEAVDELHAPDFIDHSPAGGRNADNEGFKAGIRNHYRAFPDFYAATEELAIDEAAGKVTILWAATGTHVGEYLGVAPTGRRIAFRGIEILRIENDRVAERWGEWDGMDLLVQLGLWKG